MKSVVDCIIKKKDIFIFYKCNKYEVLYSRKIMFLNLQFYYTCTLESLSKFLWTGVAVTDTSHKDEKATIIDKGLLILFFYFIFNSRNFAPIN